MLIKETNRTRIEEMIKEAEGRATARTIDYEDVEKAILYLEEKLDIPKKHMEGIKAHIDINAQAFPNAYQHTPISTHIHIIRKKTGWDLVKVSRDICKSPTQKFKVWLTDKAKEAIIDRFSHFA